MPEDTLHTLHIIQAFLLCLVCCSYCYSHEETVTTKKTQGLLVASKGCLEYCCSMALIQTIILHVQWVRLFSSEITFFWVATNWLWRLWTYDAQIATILIPFLHSNSTYQPVYLVQPSITQYLHHHRTFEPLDYGSSFGMFVVTLGQGIWLVHSLLWNSDDIFHTQILVWLFW